MLSISTDFSYRVFITDEGFVNVSVRSGTRDWHFVANAFDDSKDIGGVIWDLHWLTASQKNEVSKAVTQALLQWSGEDSMPIHVQRDQMDFSEGNREAMSWFERVLLLGIWLYVLVLTWIVSKTDVGASWGW